MKILSQLFAAIFMISILGSCNTRSQVKAESELAELPFNEFTFNADRAFVEYYNVDYVTKDINATPLLREYPSKNMVNLSPGYTIDIKDNELIIYLPYLSRILKTSLRNEDANQFSITNFTLKKAETKKGNMVYTIIPSDKKLISEIVIEVTKNGRTSVEFNTKTDQSVSYEGYIARNMALNN